VNPDIAIFGKSIGNGYPISAIIGKKKIMQVSQDTFISSTMWTDRLGFIAGIETLKKLKKYKINKKISSYGTMIKSGWIEISKKYKIDISVSGLNTVLYLKFNYPNNSEITTFFTQEMLKKNYLAGSQVATTFAYNKIIIRDYLKAVDQVFCRIKVFLDKGKFPLKGQVKHSTFRRLTG
jgi:glutamate-1-semialdehyde 2,1-aminomutase